MEAIQKQSGMRVQNQIRNNAEEVKNTLNQLYSWEKEMKDKEHKLKIGKEPKELKSPPIRSQSATMDQFAVKPSTNANPVKKKTFEADEQQQNRSAQADIFKERGNTQVKLGKYEKAILEYTAAIGAFDGDPKFYTNRALCHLKLERYNECIEDCNRAIEIDNLTVKAYYRRMQANENLGFNTKALKDCTTVLMIDSKNTDARASLQRINQKLKKTGAVPKGYPMTDSNGSSEGPYFSPLRSNMVDIVPTFKPSNARSKKPLKKVPIIDVINPKESKDFENSNTQISDEVIDKLFNGECGSYEEVKKPPTIDKIKVIDVQKDSNKLSSEKTITKPPKVSKLEAQLTSITKPRSLPPSPTSTAQFYSNWKELSVEQKYQYIKSIQLSQLNKILGAGFDSDTLTDLLVIFKEFYVSNKEIEVCETLAEISKHDRLPILSLLLSTDDKTALSAVLSYITENSGNIDHINIIRKSFSLE